MRFPNILMVVTATLALSPNIAIAQGATDYPSKTVRIIVGSSPGGGADQTARILAQKLNESWGTTIGLGTVILTYALAQAAAALLIFASAARSGVFSLVRPRSINTTTLDWMRTRMAAYEVPRKIEFIDALPRTPSGKIQWRALQEKEFETRG